MPSGTCRRGGGGSPKTGCPNSVQFVDPENPGTPPEVEGPAGRHPVLSDPSTPPVPGQAESAVTVSSDKVEGTAIAQLRLLPVY